MTTVDSRWARELAGEHLADVLPRRWAHVQAVGAEAERIASAFGDDGELVACAAWLHDIGYAPDLAESGFHPLDGARYLRRLGADDRLVRLVAHHSVAYIEAGLRGLGDELAEFEREQSAASDALWYCDLTTGPDGQRFAVAERLDEIQERYGPGDLVTRFIDLARAEMVGAVERTQERLAAAGLALV